MERLLSLIGIALMLGGCWFFSRSRARIPWRVVTVGIGLQVYLALFLVRPESVPWLLTIACGLCLGILTAGRSWLDGDDEDGTSWRAFGLTAARALGHLGFLTTIITLLYAYPSWAMKALILLPAFLVYLLPRFRSSLSNEVNSVATWTGCVLPAVLVWQGSLPRDFVFRALQGMADGVVLIIGFAGEGASQVFGGLADPSAGMGWIFAVQVGAIVIFFSALMSVLYYIGLLPWLVGKMADLLRRALGVSGAEALSAASNVFVGQTEAPLVVRPYLPGMTRSEVMALMTGGFATIAGSVFGAYVGFLQNGGFEAGAVNLIAASVMSAPAAFVFAKMLVPETETSATASSARMPRDQAGVNLLDAITGGVTTGVRLAVNIVAMLLVFYALIAMLDWVVKEASAYWHARWGDPNAAPLVFKDLYGPIFEPFALLIGVPNADREVVGELIGTKTIFNEFIAYEQLGVAVSENRIGTRAAILSTYALCGFANFMSIGIQIGGLSALAPGRRADFAKLALKAMVAGALACQLTAAIVSVIGDF